MLSHYKAIMHREAIGELLKSVGLFLTSICSTAGTFMVHSLPFLQWCLVVVGIISGYYSIRASRATHDAIKKNKD